MDIKKLIFSRWKRIRATEQHDGTFYSTEQHDGTFYSTEQRDETFYSIEPPFAPFDEDIYVQYDEGALLVAAKLPDLPMRPDEARWYGVRLIEAAARAEGDRAVETE